MVYALVRIHWAARDDLFHFTVCKLNLIHYIVCKLYLILLNGKKMVKLFEDWILL